MFGLVVLIVGFLFGNGATQETKSLEFSEFVDQISNEKVATLKISSSSRSYSGTLKDGTKFIAYAPTDYDMAIVSQEYVVPQAASGKLKVESVKPNNWLSLLSLIPTVILIVLMVIMMRNMNGQNGKGVMSFGKSRARMVKEKEITFEQVAGLDEEKQELSEIVDFLKNPKKYTELGARIPKGVLLVGPPGTGKTHISRAVAGEAGVPFFSISGSDFVEMFVGVGASRVRDLFEDAKRNAPCIVFIDEIDAVGRRRGAGIGGGNDEREQTLNQLLVEMDGFDINEGIIVLAATNRPDVLDPAILRPGRFDRQVTISVPDVKGRQAIFELYAKNKPLDENVDLSVLAKRTPGFTPADIENMMNEAALLTARRNGTIIHMDDLEEAITRVIAGPKKTSRVMSEKEKKLTAYHEAGHAVIQRCLPGSDPVHQVTIMPRGSAGGFTMTLPEEDKYYATKADMEDEIVDLLGGRLAEAIVIGDISTGASNDLERATKIAHDMVTKYGMSEAIGPVNYSDADEVFLGRDFTSKQNYSEDLASKIDKEVRRIMDEAYARGKKILEEHRAELDRVAGALLELETLGEEEFEDVFTGKRTPAEIAEANGIKAKVRKEKEDKEAEERRKKEEEENRKPTRDEQIAEALKQGKRVAFIDKKGNFEILKEMADEFMKGPDDDEFYDDEWDGDPEDREADASEENDEKEKEE
ncbi:MAG: ATP-dependent zinc metalloprotease FtsH [Firmicutes bacterium]|nr:ATP-dependent zinc metalloprotease FtsH [Bacillota bacterium]